MPFPTMSIYCWLLDLAHRHLLLEERELAPITVRMLSLTHVLPLFQMRHPDSEALRQGRASDRVAMRSDVTSRPRALQAARVGAHPSL